VLFRMSGRQYRPTELNFFKNIVASVLFLATFLVMGQELAHSAPAADYLILLLSGVLGIAVGDTLFFKSLNIVGAGLSQIVSLAYSPFVIFFTFTFLHERLTQWDLLGAVLILLGIFLTTTREQEHGLSKHDLRVGVTLATFAVAINALGITIAKPVLDRSPVLWATAIRLAGGVAANTLRPSRSWRVAIPAAFMGAYLAMFVWVAGVKFTQASTASILNQMSAIFVLPMAAIMLHERITLRKLIAVAMAIAGVVLVTLA